MILPILFGTALGALAGFLAGYAMLLRDRLRASRRAVGWYRKRGADGRFRAKDRLAEDAVCKAAPGPKAKKMLGERG